MITKHPVTCSSLLLTAWLAMTSLLPNPAAASSGTIYPLLPDLPGADIRGEARIVIYLYPDISLVEDDGQLYALDGPIDVAFDGLDHITLLFVVPSDASVFVTEDGWWTGSLVASPTSKLLAFDVYESSGPHAEPDELGFELAPPGQGAPTIPTVVIRPTDDDPDPR